MGLGILIFPFKARKGHDKIALHERGSSNFWKCLKVRWLKIQKEKRKLIIVFCSASEKFNPEFSFKIIFIRKI